MLIGIPFGYFLGMGIFIALLIGTFLITLKKRQAYRREKKSLTPLNLILVICVIFDFLIFAELAFALLYVQTDAINMTNSSKRWFELYLENQRNEFGARDIDEFVRTLPADQKRICFIGDSFTVGHGIKDIHDRFSNLIEEKLEKQNPGQFKVANLADPGLEISQIEARVRGVLEKGMQVDELIYVMCLNDIEGYIPEVLEKVKSVGNSQPEFFLFKHTYLFNWLYFRYVQYTTPGLDQYFPELAKSYDSFAFDGFKRKLDQLAALCKSNNVKFSMVVFPFLHDLKENSIFHPVHQKIVKYCAENKIAVVDLEPVMLKHSDENLVVNRFDAHPNEKANQYAAETIFETLFQAKEKKSVKERETSSGEVEK